MFLSIFCSALLPWWLLPVHAAFHVVYTLLSAIVPKWATDQNKQRIMVRSIYHPHCLIGTGMTSQRYRGKRFCREVIDHCTLAIPCPRYSIYITVSITHQRMNALSHPCLRVSLSCINLKVFSVSMHTFHNKLNEYGVLQNARKVGSMKGVWCLILNILNFLDFAAHTWYATTFAAVIFQQARYYSIGIISGTI